MGAFCRCLGCLESCYTFGVSRALSWGFLTLILIASVNAWAGKKPLSPPPKPLTPEEKAKLAEREACVKPLLKKTKVLPAHANIACAQEKRNPDYEACLQRLARVDKGPELFSAGAARSICAPGNEVNALCIADMILKNGIGNADNAAQICNVPTEGGRECVVKHFKGQKKFRFLKDALEICKYRSDSTRSCLLSYLNEEAPFNFEYDEMTRLFPNLGNAAQLCQIDNRKDRGCALRVYRKKPLAGVTGAYKECAVMADSEFHDCMNILERDLHMGNSRATEICSHPNFEVRSCMIEGMRSKEAKPFFSSVASVCEAEFLKNLMKPLNGNAYGPGCNFQR